MPSTENRRRRWYDWLGLAPSRLIRILLVLSIFPILGASILLVYTWRASKFNLDEMSTLPESCVAYDTNGKVIGALTSEARVNVCRQDLPDNLVNAFVAREDEDFFDHGGIAYTSVLRSMLKNLTSWSYQQGGSTITMQLARTCYELKAKTMDRKILEMALARRIESRYSKDFILTSYLNRIFFGQGCYGVAQAARKYFGKNVADLNLVECATIAGLVRGPSIFNPISNPEASVRERNATLDRMADCGFISAEEAEEAKEIPLTLASSSGRSLMSYPIIWINRELDLLSEEHIADTSGIFALTSIDLNEQRELEKLCERSLVELENSPIWEEMPKRTDDLAKGCLQVAALCVDSKSGNVISIVGGRCPLDNVDRWVSKKHPGALFLPLVNLAADVNNLNIVRNNPVSTGRHVGYRRMMEFAKKVGINEKLPAADELYQGLFSVPLIDMVRLTMIIQQRGRNLKFNAIQKVATTRGSLLYSSAETAEEAKREILPRESTRIVSRISPYTKDMFTGVVTMSVQLPESDGFVGACISDDRAFFVWLGFDENASTLLSKRKVAMAVHNKSLAIAKDYYAGMKERQKAIASQEK